MFRVVRAPAIESALYLPESQQYKRLATAASGIERASELYATLPGIGWEGHTTLPTVLRSEIITWLRGQECDGEGGILSKCNSCFCSGCLKIFVLHGDNNKKQILLTFQKE